MYISLDWLFTDLNSSRDSGAINISSVVIFRVLLVRKQLSEQALALSNEIYETTLWNNSRTLIDVIVVIGSNSSINNRNFKQKFRQTHQFFCRHRCIGKEQTHTHTLNEKKFK